MNLESVMLSEISQSQKHKNCMITLYMRLKRVVKFRDREKLAVARGWKGEEWEFTVQYIELQLGKMKKSWDGGW